MKLPMPSVHRLVTFGAVCCGACVLVAAMHANHGSTSPATQPTSSNNTPIPDPDAIGAIHFDHTIHAGKYHMNCLWCHVDATQAQVAGMPSLQKCMGCHKFVDKKKPGVQALAKLWREGEPPRWQRLYTLPDYVYFSHEMHVTKAQLKCAACHGDVASMKRVRRVSPLTMGWCLSCHTKRHAPTTCITCHK